MNLIRQNTDAIKQLCEKYSVKTLLVFGSVLTNKFSDQSDIDLVVEFDGVALYHYAENYWNFKDALENLFNRSVDLLERQAIKNPYLLTSIDKSSNLIYERDAQTVV